MVAPTVVVGTFRRLGTRDAEDVVPYGFFEGLIVFVGEGLGPPAKSTQIIRLTQTNYSPAGAYPLCKQMPAGGRQVPALRVVENFIV